MTMLKRLEEYFRDRRIRKLESELSRGIMSQDYVIGQLQQRYATNLILNSHIRHLLSEHKMRFNGLLDAIDSLNKEEDTE